MPSNPRSIRCRQRSNKCSTTVRSKSMLLRTRLNNPRILLIKGTKTRLTQLEQQVARRRQLRGQIIAHRRDELLNVKSLQWDASEVGTQNPEESPVAPLRSTYRKSTQVAFREPHGLHIQVHNG